jgi:hypothetical protein
MSLVPKSLRRPVTSSDLIGTAVALLVLAGLVATGHHEAAVTIVATAVGIDLLAALRRRRGRRRTSTRADTSGAVQTHRIQEAIKLWHAPETVWSLIHPAENAPVLNPEVARGYQVPGTPIGVGEQQAFVDLAGTTSVIEVVEYLERRRAMTKYVSPTLPVRMTHAVEPVADGCILTYAQEYDGPPSHTLTPESAQQWRAGARTYLERVRSTLVTWQITPDGR